MELVKYLSAKLERLESEESAEDFPVLEVDVLDSPTDDDSVEVFIVVEALHSAPDVPAVPKFDDYSDEEQQSPTSQFVDQRRSQPVYDSYESDSELDMWDFQEQTSEPYPLFINEKYYEEISHPGPAERLSNSLKSKSFPTGPVYDDYESDPWESHEEEERKQKAVYSYCPEPTSEQPLSETSQPASTFTHLCLLEIFSHV
jgi:hypothetical protein